MFGILNIDKPNGLTSRDVVNRVQRAAGTSKVGHAGTLDPLATGVLVVCLGPATRLIEFIQRKRKCYLATFLFGRHSETDDAEGAVLELPDAPRVTREQVETALPRFLGRIEQRPPAFSAVKVRGQRAYQLARAGRAVELAARPVDVFSLTIRGFAYPELQLEIECGSGTYVRAIGRDLAEFLGTAAVMTELRRTAIGEFCVEEAVALAALDSPEHVATHLLPPQWAVSDLPTIRLTDEELARLRHGQPIADRFFSAGREIAGMDASDQLAAILLPTTTGLLRPDRVFPAA